MRSRPDASAAEMKDLIEVPRMGPLTAFAVTDRLYAIAFSTAGGLQLKLYDHDARLVAELAEPLPDHAPIALFPVAQGFILVSNRGYVLVQPDGTVQAREDVPRSAFIAAALMTEDVECGLISVFVDYESAQWSIQQRCVDLEGFKLKDTIKGVEGVERGQLFSLALDSVDPQRILLAAPDATQARTWVLSTCQFSDPAGCKAVRLQSVPHHVGMLIKGLPLLPLDRRSVGVLSATEDWRNAWTGRFSRRGGPPQSVRQLPVPLVRENGYSLIESLAAVRSGADVWIGYAYWAVNGNWTAASKPTEQRSVIAVKKLTPGELFGVRR